MKEYKAVKTQLEPLYELANICQDVLFWETDAQLNFTYINPALLNQTGLEPKQILGKKLNSILLPADEKQLNDLFNSKNEMEFNNLEFKFITGSRISYLNVNAKSIKKDNEIIGYLGVCSLKTKDIISEKVIKRLQNTSKTILNSLSEALIIVDRSKRIIVISPTFNHIWKFKKGEIHLNSMQKTLEKMHQLLVHNHNKVSLDFSQKLDSLENTKDVLKFKDGRIIERKSFPYLYENKIVGRCWSFKDITQQTILIDKLGKLAFRDSLTKLYNRRWCEKKLKHLLKKPNIKNLAFMYLDLDHFKVINDSCGHIHGDDVLEQISLLLLRSVGADACLSRLGGDEFGLILEYKSETEVIEVSDDIRKAITSYSYQWKEKLFKIGVSIGIVFVNGKDDFRSVFIHADEACYLSKENGRNKATIYNADQKEFKKTRTELKWYDAIQKALLKGRFELWYQSINGRDSEWQHYEILLRMRNEEGKLISPSLFMDSAERFGMIFTIDKRVIEDFCHFYSQHVDVIKNKAFSINISGHSLSRDSFLTFVITSFDKYKINYKNICFEITENEIIKNLDKALMFINEIRSKGCKISLDDFGRGLTSFSYLKNIPFDYIKIDGQFIKEINADKLNLTVIKSIVYIAEVMNKKTIAEHIENEETFLQVEELGVNYFQGYYFSQPQQITKLLE